MAQIKHSLIFAFLCIATFLIAKPKTTMPPIHVYLTNTDMECGKSTPTHIRVKDFKNVTNFQFTVHFVNSRIKGDSVVKVNPKFPETAVTSATMPNGDISFSWSGSPVSLNDDEVLFTAYLTPYFYGITGNGYTPITIANMPTPIQAYTSASITMTYPVTTANAQIKIIDKTVPTAICPNSQFYKGLDSVLVANITGVAIDDCGGAVITNYKMTGANNIMGTNDANGKYYKLGVTKVVYTATDYAGNTAQCPFKIILVKDIDDTLTVFANSQLTKCENSSFMDFAVFIGNADGKNLNKLNFSLSWNKANFQFLNTLQLSPSLAGGTFNTTMSADGRLGFTWSGSNLNLTDNMRLFTIRLKPMGLASQTAVMVSGLPTPVAVSSPTLSSYPVRTEPGELFIVDTKAPDLACRPDTLIYATTPTGPTLVPASAFKPKLTENCILDKYNYKMIDATVAQGLFDENLSYNFNEGNTNVTFNALDYGGGTASCNSNVKVNRLKFTVSKDSVPCATTSTNITVKVKDFEKLKDSKYTITWNPTMMSLNQAAITYIDNTIKNNMTISGNVSSGSLTFTWALPSGSHTVADDAILMTLPFNLIGKVNSPVTFNFDGGRVINTSNNITAQVINGSVKNYDTQKPVITNCPSDKIEIVTQAGVCTKKVSWNVPTVTDDCDVLVNNNTKIYKQLGTTFPPNTPTFSGDDFGLGQNIITYVASDVFGNTSTCAFTINVSENVPPQIVACVTNVSASTEPGKNGASLSWGNPTVNESCGIQSEVYSKAKGSYFIVGKQTVTYTVTDKSGNSSSCTFTVTVTDNENPVFNNATFPSNTTIVAQTDTCGAKVTWNPPTATDNHTAANLIKITSNFASGSFFPVGKTTVTYTAVDSSGNAVIRNFEVTVLDGQAPKFVNCPAEITVSATPTLCNAVITPPVLKTKDNCKGLIDVFPTGVPANNAFPIGSTPLLYTDPNDPNVKCPVNLVVKVTQKPVFTALNDISVSTNPNDCKGTLPASAKPSATDACGNTNSVTITQAPTGNQFASGVNIITYTATDTYGNTTTATVKFIVTDINPPTLSACPKDITANAEPGKSGANITWIPPTAKAFCNGAITLVPTQQPNTLFPIGTTPVTYTATDNNGNSLTCSFTVKVIDNQPPVINCPPTKQLSATAAAGTCSQIVPLPTFTDNSGKIPTIVSSNGVNPNNVYPAGKTVINFTVSDEAGNTASCSFDIIVKITDKPTLTAVTDITLSTDPNDCKGTLPATAKPSATDACGNNTVTVTQNPNLTTFPIGTTTVTFTATDTYGNTSTTSFKVTVKDNNPPTMTNCPADITAKAEAGKKGAIITWTPPTAKAFCNGTVNVVSTNQPNTFYNIGNTVVTYTATDQSGNTLTCSFNINVSDGEPPVINCPPTKQVNLNADPVLCGQAFALPTFSDNSGIAPTIISSTGIPVGNLYPVGKTTVSFTIADNGGNTASCTFDVIVKDLIKPTFANVKDITVNTDPTSCTAKLSPADLPQATDGCGNTTIDIKSNIDTDKLPQGVSTVILVATDPDGNKENATFKVTVVDNVPPVLAACPNKIILPTDPGKDFATANWIAPIASDNCAVTVKSSNKPGDTFTIGTKIVTYTATDASGNTTTCTFEVEVTDQEKPTIACKDITVNNKAGECGGTLVTLPQITDNVKVINTVYNPTLPVNNYFNVGEQTFNISVTDAAGNLANCSLKVIIADNETPKAATCPKDITASAAVGECKVSIPSLPAPTFTDNCNAADLVITSNRDALANPLEFPAGETTKVIFTAKDKGGNTTTCEYNVIVSGSSKPTLTCPNAISVKISPNKCDTVLNWLPANATVACSPLVGTPKASINSGSIFKAGTTSVTYSIKDQSGQEGTCTFDVIVKESTKPTFASNFPKDTELPANPLDCSAIYTWAAPTAIDNCTTAADLVIKQIAGPNAGDKLDIGVQTVTYEVTDKSGNKFEQSFKITVKDKTAPTFVLCPKDVKVDMFGKIISDPDNFIATASKSADCKTVNLTFQPIDAIDKCSIPVTITNSGATTFTIDQPTEYKYRAIDAAGNAAECKFNVTIEGLVLPNLTSSTTVSAGANMSCPNADIQLKADLIAGVTYTWTGPNGFTSNEQNPTIKNATSKDKGNYTLKITKGTCVSAESKPLKVDIMTMPKAKEDNYEMFTGDVLLDTVFPNDSLIAGEATLVKVTENTKNGQLKMRNDGFFDYTPQPKFYGNDDFKYNVCYETCPTACSGPTLARIVVKVKEVKIPNVISPNDDGMNDVMIIDYPFNGTEKAELNIYNEWGHLVYGVKPFTNAQAWNGTFKDQPVPDGTYFYVFTVDEGAEVIKGFITVLR